MLMMLTPHNIKSVASHPCIMCDLQILEQIYLIYRGRYFYPVVINLFSVPALHAMAAMLNQQRKKVMALMNESRLTPMVLGQWVRATSSHRLVPGDVIVLQSGRALCDMVLLRGACLVTEAVLSGEVGFNPMSPLPGVATCTDNKKKLGPMKQSN